jgi:hypothetical protein
VDAREPSPRRLRSCHVRVMRRALLGQTTTDSALFRQLRSPKIGSDQRRRANFGNSFRLNRARRPARHEKRRRRRSPADRPRTGVSPDWACADQPTMDRSPPVAALVVVVFLTACGTGQATAPTRPAAAHAVREYLAHNRLGPIRTISCGRSTNRHARRCVADLRQACGVWTVTRRSDGSLAVRVSGSSYCVHVVRPDAARTTGAS